MNRISRVLITLAVVLGSLGLAPAAHAAVAAGVSTQSDCPALDVSPDPIQPEGTNTGHFPVFRWSAVPGIDEYVVFILYASDDEEYVIDGQPFTVGGTSFRPPAPLPFYTGMRWKVKTECDEQYGPFSRSVYFDLEPRCRPRDC